ncbi:MAG: peptide chain release factor 2 [Chloroflexi bacterium]|nr:peptide chain release factor 2 [Chloroflexota bacterium]
MSSIEAKAGEAGFWDNYQSAQNYMVRLSELKDIVESWQNIEDKVSSTIDLIDLIIQEADFSLASSIEEDIKEIEDDLDHREFLLTLSGEHDQRGAILAIHSGAGGTESQDWAQMLLRMYLRWSDNNGFQTTILDMSSGDEAGIKSVTVNVTGTFAYGNLKSEIGVHRLVRLSPFDSDHARHTSFALVEVLPESEGNAEIVINNDDIRVDVFKASGHGGQSVQKNSTAIRITHLPTSIVVTCQNERSQFQNKEHAMKVLRARLMDLQLKNRAEEQAKLKGEHVSAEWGNQIRSYVLHPYRMVKDHRTGYETSNTDEVLDGNIDQFLKSYLIANIK